MTALVPISWLPALRPSPHFAHPVRHVKFVLHDIDDPGMLKHLFWRGPDLSISGQSMWPHQSALLVRMERRQKDSRFLHEVLHLWTVHDLLLILKLGRLIVRAKQRDDRWRSRHKAQRTAQVPRSGTTYLILEDVHHKLDRGEIGREWEPVCHELKQCNACGPNV